MKSIYDFTIQMPNGTEKTLKEYDGKPLIVVNTASKCGLTPQFKGLQELYEQYSDQGLEIIGFPCDQFNNQEYENIEETTQFCQINYGVTFPITTKIDVNGENAHPLSTFLKKQKKGILSDNIKWNFTKFLIDPEGQVVEPSTLQLFQVKSKKNIKKLL